MKFLHTSDWHIGRQFHNVSLLDDQRVVLAQLLDYVRDESVDAVLIAGDIYDRSVPPATAVALLDEVLHTLCDELSVPVIVIPGNHDSAERLGFAARQLKRSGLYILAELADITTPVVLEGTYGEVAFYGIPYNDPEQVRHQYEVAVTDHSEAHRYLVEQILQVRNPDIPAVLLSHCFIDGASGCESERPLSIGGADRVSYEPLLPFSYVALGHLHQPQFKGEQHIRYSGSILKYSFSEQHQKKGVTLVELDGLGICHTRFLPLTPVRDMRVLEGELQDLLEVGKTDPHADDYLLVRLTDRHAILDAMGKLREVYPNVLHLEKPGMMDVGERQVLGRDALKRSELEMFGDFFEQVTGNQLTDAQREKMKSTISALHQD